MDMKEWIQNMHYYFIKITIANKQSLTVSKYLANMEITRKKLLK
jgi:hypothetical protein